MITGRHAEAAKMDARANAIRAKYVSSIEGVTRQHGGVGEAHI
jgi:hypothetical protein